jgi:hypothetical protein
MSQNYNDYLNSSLSDGPVFNGALSYTISNGGLPPSGLSVRPTDSVNHQNNRSVNGTVAQIAADLIRLNSRNSVPSQNCNNNNNNRAPSSSTDFSSLEQTILRSSAPIEINETEQITVNGQTGIWANKAEVINWRGALPISQYPINEVFFVNSNCLLYPKNEFHK